MNEDRFNMELRKFLKRVGITAQREIEKAVQQGIASGEIAGNEALQANVVLNIPEVNLRAVIDGEIALE
ncbi:MAG: DUF6494 family protein [Gammaproteobacteria bacterium]